jgi:hypothetical protein
VGVLSPCSSASVRRTTGSCFLSLKMNPLRKRPPLNAPSLLFSIERLFRQLHFTRAQWPFRNTLPCLHRTALEVKLVRPWALGPWTFASIRWASLSPSVSTAPLAYNICINSTRCIIRRANPHPGSRKWLTGAVVPIPLESKRLTTVTSSLRTVLATVRPAFTV